MKYNLMNNDKDVVKERSDTQPTLSRIVEIGDWAHWLGSLYEGSKMLNTLNLPCACSAKRARGSGREKKSTRAPTSYSHTPEAR